MAMAKTASNRSQTLNLINNLLASLQNLCNQKNNPTIQELEKFFAKSFQLNSNGIVQCRSSQDYLKRLYHLREKYSHFDIVGPLEEPLICDNQFCVHYELGLQGKDGKKRQVLLFATGIFEDNKIANWIQITHEKSANQWDS
jgi:hypothetical protein